MKSKNTSYKGRDFIVHSDGTCTLIGHTDSIGRSKGDTILSQRPRKDSYIHYGFGVNGKTVRALAHRLVAKAFLSDYSEHLQVDHINGNRSDNRVENLRMATRSQNLLSFTKKRTGTKSKHLNVTSCPKTGRWYGSIMVKGAVHYTQRFDSEHEAFLAVSELRSSLLENLYTSQ